MVTCATTEVDCLPGASAEIVKKEKKATHHTSGKKKEKTTKGSSTTNQTLPATAQRNKIKQPHLRLALSRADTLAAMKPALKRKRIGITPDSCGKAGDPHNLDGGGLTARNPSISMKRRQAGKPVSVAMLLRSTALLAAAVCVTAAPATLFEARAANMPPLVAVQQSSGATSGCVWPVGVVST